MWGDKISKTYEKKLNEISVPVHSYSLETAKAIWFNLIRSSAILRGYYRI